MERSEFEKRVGKCPPDGLDEMSLQALEEVCDGA